MTTVIQRFAVVILFEFAIVQPTSKNFVFTKYSFIAVNKFKAKIKYENMLNELFTFSKGVKQGDGSLFISALHLSLIHI